MANFGADYDLVAIGEILQGAAEDFLTGSLRIHICGVEEVDAPVERVSDHLAALRFGQ
jgi:hypothetical protein